MPGFPSTKQPITVNEIIARWPGLQRQGQEWKGPCPNCGGRDRFHLRTRDDGFALFGCRHCIDGLPAEQKREGFRNILAKLDLATKRVDSSQRSDWTKKRAATDNSSSQAQDSLSWLKQVWQQGEDIVGTSAERYLVIRNCLPPPACRFKQKPKDVRWLSNIHFADLNAKKPPSIRWLWPKVTGCLMVGYRTGEGTLQAISFEALKIPGQLPRTRWRKTLGKRKNAWFQPWEGSRGTVLCEGECDAISLGWQFPDHTILGLGGTSQMRNWIQPRHLPTSIVIIADGDENGKGEEAARYLWAELLRKGCYAELKFCPPGEDPASQWEKMVETERDHTGSPVTAWYNLYPPRTNHA